MNLDYIEVHNSDRALFKWCRQKWDFAAPSRMNLRPKVVFAGVNFNLWYGSIIHKCLEEMYHPVLQRHPVEVFDTVFYEGTFNSKNMMDVPGVRQLKANNYTFWETNSQMFDELYELGHGMLNFYYENVAPEWDDFNVISVEQDFAVEVMEAVDWRDGKKKPVVYCGRMDAVVEERRSGRLSILDHKTAASMPDDYFTKLEMDEQCTSYVWAQHKVLDLPFASIRGVWYNVLRKAVPRPPTVVRDGKALSVNRQEESTTVGLWDEAISELGLHDWFSTTKRAQEYREFLIEQGIQNFVRREWVPRTADELRIWESQLKDELSDLVANPRIYRSPSGAPGCIRCEFRTPCLEKYAGEDYEIFLHDNYERNVTRG